MRRQRAVSCVVYAAIALLISSPAFAIDVFSEADLRNAIETARTTPDTEIVLRNNIVLSQDLPALQGTRTTIRSETGQKYEINGGGQYRGLFVYSGSTSVQDLTIIDAAARGGNGGNGGSAGGGGGAGLGGALFVNAGATVTVSNVDLLNNQAIGGAGGAGVGPSGGIGGGGGMGGHGGNNPGGKGGAGGGGGVGVGANGGSDPFPTAGQPGIVTGAPSGGAGDGGPGGANGGGGGANDGGGGGVGGGPNTGTGSGGFGGGAGGFANVPVGGFGGGGSANFDGAGIGGFGGGGGYSTQKNFAASGGFGGGNGGSNAGFGGGGGGGAGMGGAIFVVEGGTLVLQGDLNIDGNSVEGGLGGAINATAGSAFGSGLFLQGDGTLTFSPDAGRQQVIDDVIADQTGSGGSGTYATGGPICTPGVGCDGYSGAGVWSLSKIGAGTLVLNGDNTFSGGVTINGGTISVGHDNALGSGTFTVLESTLDIQDGITVSNATDLQADLDINVNAGATGTHAGDISSTGAFGINKIGGGTLILSGANTYSGGTGVTAGVLRAGAANTFAANSSHSVAAGATLDLNNFAQTIGSLAGAGNVMLGLARLTVGGDNQSTLFAGTVSGSAAAGSDAFVKVGTGTLTFSGNNIYSGQTVVSGGTLQAGAANAFSAASIHRVEAGATLDLNGFDQTIGALDLTGHVTLGSGTLTLAGVSGLVAANFGGDISGQGGVTKQGTYSQSLSGTNGYFGTTTVAAGTLEAAALHTLSPNSTHVINSGATLNLNGLDQVIGALAGAGDVTLLGARLSAGGNNSSTEFSGTMTGAGGFTKHGTGTQIFSSTIDYSGDTVVDAGALMVNGALTNSNTIVNANGLLGGTGTVQAVVVNGGGVFAPGSGVPGTQMTVNGPLDFAGGIYRVAVSPTVASSAIVNGIANLSGGTVHAQFTPGSYLLRQYVILQAAGLTGAFAGLTASNLPVGFAADLLNQGNDVVLQLSPAVPYVTGLSIKQQNVLDAITNSFINDASLPPEFAALYGLSGDAFLNALSQASGEPGAAIATSTFMAWNQFFNMIFDPSGSGRRTVGGPSEAVPFAEARGRGDDVALAYAAAPSRRDPGETTVSIPSRSHWSMWGGGYGGSATTQGDAIQGSHDTTSRAYGFAAGADREVAPGSLIGFALAGGGTSFGLADGLGGGRSDLFQASLYARQDWNAAYLMAAFGYGWQDFTTERTVTIAGTDRLEARFDAHTVAGRVEGGWRFGSELTGMAPYAAFQVASIALPAYAEQATSGSNAFTLAYSGRTDTQKRAELGARFDHAMPVLDGVLKLHGRAAWAHDFDSSRVADAVFLTLPGAAFSVGGARPDADALLVSAGAEIAWANGFSLAGSFEGEFSGNTDSYAGKGAIRYRW